LVVPMSQSSAAPPSSANVPILRSTSSRPAGSSSASACALSWLSQRASWQASQPVICDERAFKLLLCKATSRRASCGFF
jgi:hypothetical protein